MEIRVKSIFIVLKQNSSCLRNLLSHTKLYVLKKIYFSLLFKKINYILIYGIKTESFGASNHTKMETNVVMH